MLFLKDIIKVDLMPNISKVTNLSKPTQITTRAVSKRKVVSEKEVQDSSLSLRPRVPSASSNMDSSTTSSPPLTANMGINPVELVASMRVVSQTVLTTFVGGLLGNLGGIVRAWRPQDLEEAYDVAIKERNLYFSESSAYSQQRQPMRQNDRFRPNYNQLQNRDRDHFQNRAYNQYQSRDRYQYQNRDNNRYSRNTYENNNRNSRYPAILPSDDTPSTSNAAAKKNANVNRPSTNGQRLFNIETNTKTNDTDSAHNFEEDENFRAGASKNKQDS